MTSICKFDGVAGRRHRVAATTVMTTSLIMSGFLSLVILGGCRDSTESPLPLISAHHDHDRIEWRDSMDEQGSSTARLFVQCSEGIGRVELARPESGWPARLTISLKLAALEGFSLSANGHRFQLEVTSDREILLEPTAGNPLTLVGTPQDNHSQNTFIVGVSLDQRFSDAPKLIVRWVDFYR